MAEADEIARKDEECTPCEVWSRVMGYHIGGYQPAQKWLKDRRSRRLDYDDIMHYHKIINALYLTDQIMKEIDNEVNLLA
jgi:hypothetical protein